MVKLKIRLLKRTKKTEVEELQHQIATVRKMTTIKSAP